MTDEAREAAPARLLLGLLDEAREPILALDEDGKIVRANAAAAAYFGQARRFLVGKPFTSVVEVPDRRRFRTAIGAVELDGADVELHLVGRSERITVALRRLPGVTPPVISAVIGPAPAPAPAPAPETTVALDHFFLRYPHAVIGLRADGRVAFANPRARRILGETAVRVGRPLVEPPELRQLADRLIALPTVLRPAHIELADGRILRAIGVGARRDEPAVMIIEDATEQQRRDAVLQEFLRNAAHQLRTPLTGIATAVEVLQSGAKEIPEQRDLFLGHLEKDTTRLTRIARGLLTLARAQSGETLRLELVELEPILTDLAHGVQPATGVEMSVDCPPKLAALAEPDLTREALSSLLDNAVRHTRHGRIGLSAAERNGDVNVHVTDTGGGVLPEHRERIFEPFYRPAAHGDGFGLGLAIAFQAVKAMGGDLIVGDADGGTRFTVRLPSARIKR